MFLLYPYLVTFYACSFNSEVFMITLILENTIRRFVEYVIITLVIYGIFLSICLFPLQTLLQLH